MTHETEGSSGKAAARTPGTVEACAWTNVYGEQCRRSILASVYCKEDDCPLKAAPAVDEPPGGEALTMFDPRAKSDANAAPPYGWTTRTGEYATPGDRAAPAAPGAEPDAVTLDTVNMEPSDDYIFRLAQILAEGITQTREGEALRRLAVDYLAQRKLLLAKLRRRDGATPATRTEAGK